LHVKEETKAALMKREIKAIEHWAASETVGGLHLLGEWYGCHGPTLLLQDATELRQLCRAASQQAGLTIIGDRFHQVSAPLGVMGTVLLAESHLAIHTWPEARFATLDVFVCNHALNNRAKAHALYGALRESLAPGNENFLQVKRGEVVELVLRPH
jgi:S-adenosylmethionine decarboxylase proenzyme